MELPIDGIYIDKIANGYLIRIDYEPDGDDYKTEKFFFNTVGEVLTFIETNLD
jgi:hypothetical protein